MLSIYLVILFLGWGFLIFHLCVHKPWSIFITAALKSLSNNSNISHLGVGIYQLFFYLAGDLLSSSYNEKFSIQTWMFSYYVMRFWILFKSSVTAGLHGHCSSRRRGHCHITARRGGSPSSPHGLHWHLVGRCSLWPLGGGGSPGSPQVLHWHHRLVLGEAVTTQRGWKSPLLTRPSLIPPQWQGGAPLYSLAR